MLRAQVERLSLQHAVRFASAMPARRALTLGKVMVIPSRAELLPYVVLETAAASKPLITTSVGGIPEIYGPLSNALVPAGDAEALANAITRVLSRPGRRKRARAQPCATASPCSSPIDMMVEGVIWRISPSMGRARESGSNRARDQAVVALTTR